MALHRDPAKQFEQRLRTLTTAGGITLPDDMIELQARLRDFQRKGRPIRDRIAQGLIDGDTTVDYPLLWAAALAEGAQNPPLVTEVFDGVRTLVNAEIRQRYARNAIPIYTTVATQFDDIAAKFTAAAEAVDPELDATAVLDMPVKDQKAWREAATQKAELDRLMRPLAAAAQLAGIVFSDDDTDLLPLCVDPAGHHRRKLWEAWETDQREELAARKAAGGSPFNLPPAVRSRCGRWAALVALGATIRACPPEEFQPYRRPARLIERMENSPTGPRRILIDPEDEPAQTIGV